MDSLSLLTTHHRPNERIFTTTNATSAAMALAARLAARIMVVYPTLWPETVRALIVHSAEWTEALRRASLPATGKIAKADYECLLRRCGFGVPDLERALWSVENSLTMVVEERLHPFRRECSKPPQLRDMQLHNLPWPREALEALGETRVEMRVTLSYFIEPNPSRRGLRSRYRYESHGLRFDVKRPQESVDEFGRGSMRPRWTRRRGLPADVAAIPGGSSGSSFDTEARCTGTSELAVPRISRAGDASPSTRRWVGGRPARRSSGTTVLRDMHWSSASGHRRSM